MSDRALPHHKDFCSKPDNNNNNKDRIIATVTKCLSPTHYNCSGKYVDYLTGLNIVKCECSCHFTAKKEDYCFDESADHAERPSTALYERTDEDGD